MLLFVVVNFVPPLIVWVIWGLKAAVLSFVALETLYWAATMFFTGLGRGWVRDERGRLRLGPKR